MNRLIQLKQTPSVFLAAFGLACFGLLSAVQAVSPPPDGGYPGGNTAEGQNALLSVAGGTYNTAVGFLSLLSNTTGNFNTGVGAGALLGNTALGNTATGAGALLSNKVAIYNTASGVFALFNNDSTGNGAGNWNSAFGASALFSNTDGVQNAAFGESAMFANTTGSFNTALGDNALRLNQTGSGNTAVGYFALQQNTAGGNTATGYGALTADTTGGSNTADGGGTLPSNTTGASNTAIGYQALFNTTTGSFNTALGAVAGDGITTANNVICIGSIGMNIDNSTWISNIYGTTTQSGTTLPVIVSDGGQLGTTPSSRRFKKEIQPMDKASEAILGLKPVTFHYKSDKTGTPQFGLIAEEVAKVNPNLVARDKNGEIYTVRYDAVNAMLLNEFLKEHKKTEKLEATVASLITTVKAQAAQIQRVSAQLEASKPAQQVAESNY